MIPSVMKRIAPPTAWIMKKVAGRPRSLARLQQTGEPPQPGQTRTPSTQTCLLNGIIKQTQSHVSVTVATVPSRTPARQRVPVQQTWTVPAARQQSLMVHQREHCCWHRELLGNIHTPHKETIVNHEQWSVRRCSHLPSTPLCLSVIHIFYIESY